MPSKLSEPLSYLNGVGAAKAALLKSELGLKTCKDLLNYYPFRHEDRSEVKKINELMDENINIVLKGKIISLSKIGKGAGRLEGIFQDETGEIKLVWFRGAQWIQKSLALNTEYLLYGKVSRFNNKMNIAHPELMLFSESMNKSIDGLQPVYSTTEKLIKKGLDSKGLRRITKNLFKFIASDPIDEVLPQRILEKLQLVDRKKALEQIHFPTNEVLLRKAKQRLKFEELFFLQLDLIFLKKSRQINSKGIVFDKVGEHFNSFYRDHLPFLLTDAQKRVVKEIRADFGSGMQMNRLLQGDVGSGKTITSFLCMLIAMDNGYQSCLMAPTEILAQQHFNSLSTLCADLDIQIGFLSGSITGKKRKVLLEDLAAGSIDILVGTHAVIEDPVVFNNLGLAITDEQHRFGVDQRSKLWQKARDIPPHILVMTATPIPRTLAMSYYGDLDISIIDELPPGRKPIRTIHFYESQRSRLNGFMKEQIHLGRQIYVVFPLIEESSTLDLQNLQDGYEQLLLFFPRPEYQIGVVHGRMKAKDKDDEMQRFVSKKINILVATTVIEVGVDVPNATVMIIENSERFGLSQLHQLRGRVGRGAEQSYCILMSSYKVSKEAKKRIKTMVNTNDGFEIAEVDLEMRGPGVIAGTRQSGDLGLQLSDLSKDEVILKSARNIVMGILTEDPRLTLVENKVLRKHLIENRKRLVDWSRIG